jgi:hypothetical protein
MAQSSTHARGRASCAVGRREVRELVSRKGAKVQSKTPREKPAFLCGSSFVFAALREKSYS